VAAEAEEVHHEDEEVLALVEEVAAEVVVVGFLEAEAAVSPPEAGEVQVEASLVDGDKSLQTFLLKNMAFGLVWYYGCRAAARMSSKIK